MKTDLQCSNCNIPIEEPERTRIMNCPNCWTELFVPSRKDWQAFHDNMERLKNER